ncbi:hypothetical protein [Nitratidesulfovibrio liaohensis]|uniref:hypothetical protein n=1 Tax=Nitratidesulfovibrio liaohensis TaxID=2604158 RepID=UPI001421C970|nr:hypothetical protein [Nitratidesulfovibrio liaohensis]NHZ48614.1 hypothetical protein [Nitratidesulfovibrio liaohensis]
MEMSLCDELREIMYDADLLLQTVLPLSLFEEAPSALVALCLGQRQEELASLFAIPELATSDDSPHGTADTILFNKTGLYMAFNLPIPEDIAFDSTGDVQSYCSSHGAAWVIHVYADTMTDGVALALRERAKLLDGAFDRARKEQGV